MRSDLGGGIEQALYVFAKRFPSGMGKVPRVEELLCGFERRLDAGDSFFLAVGVR